MINLDYQKEKFANHVATFHDFGIIKVLDFQNPGCGDYRIRFIFEEDHYRLHISGDLGELTAYNFTNMVWEDFYRDFVRDPDYFEGKVITHERDLYSYDYEDAKEDLKKYLNEIEYEPDMILYDTVEEFIDSVLEDLDESRGIGSIGYETLAEIDSNAWEEVPYIGKRRTGIIELYLLAFKLAYEQLKGASS